VSKVKNLVGERFGRLVVVERAEDSKSGATRWRCRCDCGEVRIVYRGHLRSGHTASCGCLQKEMTAKINRTHGMKGTRAYFSWRNMKSRCQNPNNPDYQLYGGRGITICERWANFENFLADLGEPAPGMTLDRIDVNGPYSKNNCRWVDRKTQSRNRRDNLFVEWEGERRLLSELAEEYGISNNTLRKRVIEYEWPIQDALEVPVGGRRPHRLQSDLSVPEHVRPPMGVGSVDHPN